MTIEAILDLPAEDLSKISDEHVFPVDEQSSITVRGSLWYFLLSSCTK